MANIKWFLVLAATFLLLSTNSLAKGPWPKNLSEALNTTIENAIEEKRIVGTVVLVSRDGKVVYEQAVGYFDREAKRIMKTSSVFRLAALTKPIVAVATLVLVDQGKLKLNDPVTKWLPKFKPKLKNGTAPVITIRHLLTHTAGLNYGFLEAADGPYHKFKVSDGLDDVGISLDENIDRIALAPLLFAPGSSWQYSLAIDVLGRILEKVSGAPLQQVIQKIVTGPLKMQDTAFFTNNPEQLTVPYADGKPEPVRMSERQEVPFGLSTIIFSPRRALNRNAYASGGAGMIGTAQDYLKVLEMIRTGGAPLLKKATNLLLVTNQVGKIAANGTPALGWTLGASFLLDPQTLATPQKIGTLQWGGAYGHTWWIDPQEKLTVIILTNTAIEGMSGTFPNEVRDAIYKAL